MRRTKIVCTVGNVTDSEPVLEQLIHAGMNVARLNTSHGKPETHIEMIRKIKRIRERLNRPIGILLDLEGPKIRTGSFEEDEVFLKEGQNFELTSEELTGSCHCVSISYANLPKEVKSGDLILVYDGLVGLKVLDTDGVRIKTKVLNSGALSHRKGINVPGVDIGLPPLTDKDITYLQIAVDEQVDYIAQSFVRRPEDVEETRERLRVMNSSIPIISKIETKQAMQYLQSIIYKSDGIMVARGDLGVEIPTEDVPIAQKKIIDMSNAQSKPVITATQMLESMIVNPRPTRAEATDIANAILDGTDAIMLSGETTVGKYPVEAVSVMHRIAERIEMVQPELGAKAWQLVPLMDSPDEAISKSCVNISEELNVSVIVASTSSGSTARRISKYRPKAMIVATTPDPSTFQRLSLVWGAIPVLVSKTAGTDEMIELAVRKTKELGLARRGDQIIITAGIPWGEAGTTNMLKIHRC